MMNSKKTTTQQLPALGKEAKRKGLEKLALRPTHVPKSPDFSLDGDPTPKGGKNGTDGY